MGRSTSIEKVAVNIFSKTPRLCAPRSERGVGQHAVNTQMALEAFSIFALSGLVLWEKNFDNSQGILQGDPVGSLISNVLLQERGGTGGHYDFESHQMQYSISTAYGLVFLAVYNKGLSIPWVKKLVNDAQKVFIQKFDLSFCQNYEGGSVDFGKEFMFCLTEATGRKRGGGGGGGGGGSSSNSSGNGNGTMGAGTGRSPTRKGGMRTFSQTSKGKKVLGDGGGEDDDNSSKKKKKKKSKKNKNKGVDDMGETEQEEQGQGNGGDSKLDDETKTMFQGMSVREKRSGPRGFNKKTKNKKDGATASPKRATAHWKDPTLKKMSKKDSQRLMNSLNANDKDDKDNTNSDRAQLEEFRRKYLGDEDDGWGTPETKKVRFNLKKKKTLNEIKITSIDFDGDTTDFFLFSFCSPFVVERTNRLVLFFFVGQSHERFGISRGWERRYYGRSVGGRQTGHDCSIGEKERGARCRRCHHEFRQPIGVGPQFVHV
jgi:hypothetical protein